ncbi:MAG TPA: sulfite exporter TauE/SafE family protein [Terriglobales bacterium]|nr:sulfite exporter TauE/SafE family protein [Terriglobales bacterium]
MSSSDAAILFGVATVGGLLNSIAGGGSFITFPTLLFMGIPSVPANATNTVALWPGTVASTGAYRRSLNTGLLRRMLPLIVITFLGGAVGAALLLKTRPATFDKLIPWLLLLATIMFSLGRRINRWVARHHSQTGPSLRRVAGMTLLQALLAVYLGYFGAGVGFVIMAVLAVMGLDDVHAMNGLRTLLVTCGNAVAVGVFIVARAVYWPQALLMLTGAAIGGYAGAWYVQRLDPKKVRYFVIALGFSMSAYFFWKAYLR